MLQHVLVHNVPPFRHPLGHVVGVQEEHGVGEHVGEPGHRQLAGSLAVDVPEGVDKPQVLPGDAPVGGPEKVDWAADVPAGREVPKAVGGAEEPGAEQQPLVPGDAQDDRNRVVVALFQQLLKTDKEIIISNNLDNIYNLIIISNNLD